MCFKNSALEPSDVKRLLCFRELFSSKKCHLVGGGGRLVHGAVGGGEEEGHA